MQKRALAFFSNRMGILLEELKKNLFSEGFSPFERRIVVVPDEKLKPYLLYSFANDPQLKIASGLEILTFSSATAEILSSFQAQAHIPSSLELALKIQEKIEYLLATRENDPILEPLVSYLENGSLANRLFALSQEISRHFLRYGIYGDAFLKPWQTKKGWQQLLWNELFSDDSELSYPAKELKRVPKIDCQVHLFCFPFIPKIYLNLFQKLHAKFYLLSPCQFFWADLCSDKEKVQMFRSLRKQNRDFSQIENLDYYLREQNPLLANMGKLSRKYFSLLDEQEIEMKDLYEETEPTTLLQAIQRDLLLLQESGLKEEVFHDDSIQIHGCVSKQREIEALGATLQKIWQTDSSITPKDILVLSADISEYAPYIGEVFSNLKVDYTISDLPLGHTSPFAKAYSILISLKENRFNPDSVLKLFSQTPFLEKFAIAEDEHKAIVAWLEKLDVHWGVDEEHKGSIIANVNEKRGTWIESFEAAINGLLFPVDAHTRHHSADIEWSQAEHIGKVVHILRSLKEDLRVLEQNELTFSDWINYLECLIDSYFSIPLYEDALYLELGKISFKCLDLKMPLNFKIIDSVLNGILSQKSSSQYSSNLQSVSFGSLGQGRRSAKIVCLLGADEDSLPRKENSDALCEMKASKLKDYSPTHADEDRLYFLESLLCASDYFLIFYTKQSKEDHKTLEPSLLVQELISYLDKSYQRSAQTLIKDHPALSFDKRYFSNSELSNYSELDFRAAKAYYSSEKKPLHSFLSDFYSSSSLRRNEREKERIVDTRKLFSFAQHSLKFYMHESLGIYLDFEEEKENHEFFLSNVKKSDLKKASLGKSFASVTELAEEQRILPSGQFKQASLLRLKEDVDELATNIALLEINPLKKFEVELSISCENPTQVSQNKWLIPALKIPLTDGSEVFITGLIKDLFDQGLLLHKDHKFSSIIAAYPSFLIVYCHPFLKEKVAKKLLFAKDGKIFEEDILDPMHALCKYLEYYFLSLENPSPLFPDWAQSLINHDPAKLKKEMAASLSSRGHFMDAYLKWLFMGRVLPNAEIICDKWSEIFSEVFSPLLKEEEKV